MPDRLVGIAGINVLVEYKSPKRNLSKDQVDWWDAWRGARPHLARSVEDVQAIVAWARNLARRLG